MSGLALQGILASLLAGAATGLGGLAVMLGGAPGEARRNLLMGFAAGVMIAAAVLSLILPGIERAELGGLSRRAAMAGVMGAVLIGALAMGQLDRAIETLARRRLSEGGRRLAPGGPRGRTLPLFLVAMTLHNLPEGTAVGVSFMSGDVRLGWATATGIGVQNVPEGMAVAAVLATLGWSRMRCLAAALGTGLVEPVGGAFGVALAEASLAALPATLGFSAGAMLFVVMAEMIPGAAGPTGHDPSAPALLAGLAFMTLLDVALG
jgi:ZIP family zinc transporter